MKRTLMLNLHQIPDEIRRLQHWVCWREVKRGGKPTKLPVDPRTGKEASSTNPGSWGTFKQAIDRAAQSRENIAGIGLMFGCNGHSAGLVGVDLDHVRDPKTGTLKPWAAEVIKRLASYTEVSPSGRGVHILARATKPGPLCRKGSDREMYDAGRYFTVTGERLDGTPAEIEDGQAAIDALYSEWFGSAEAEADPRPQRQAAPALALEDEGVVRLAMRSKGSEAFLRLWQGDASDYASESEADMALLLHLAFWCRKDPAQVDRLFRQSGLMREKWDRRQNGTTWGALQVERAISKQSDVYEPSAHKPASPREEDAPAEIEAPSEEWEAPIPLTPSTGPSWPAGVLPRWIEDYVVALAEATQTPVDLGAMLSLGVIAVPCAGRVEVEIKPGFREPTNLYLSVAQPPGARKSAVYSAMVKPLRDAEHAECQRLAPAIRQASLERAIAEKRVEQLTAAAAKSGNPLERQALAAEAAELEGTLQGTAPVFPRWFADDSTPEALTRLMAEHGGRMAILSPEAGVFDLMAGLYSDGKRNLDTYLKGHSGDALRVDRRNAPPISIDKPTLTIAVTVQPFVIGGLAAQRGFRGRGLLGRFLYSMPLSSVGARKTDPPPVPDQMTIAYCEGVRRLAERMEGKTQVLHLSREAYAAWLEFSAWLEPQLADTGELGAISDWASKLAGAVARIAALLHAANPQAGETVNAETMAHAVTIGRYLLEHARVAFGVMGAVAEIDDARRILEWLREKKVSRTTQRDVQQGLRSRFPRAEDATAALTLLEEHGYLRHEPRPAATAKGGRPPSPSWMVYPGGCESSVSCSRVIGTVKDDLFSSNTETPLVSETRHTTLRTSPQDPEVLQGEEWVP